MIRRTNARLVTRLETDDDSTTALFPCFGQRHGSAPCGGNRKRRGSCDGYLDASGGFSGLAATCVDAHLRGKHALNFTFVGDGRVGSGVCEYERVSGF